MTTGFATRAILTGALLLGHASVAHALDVRFYRASDLRTKCTESEPLNVFRFRAGLVNLQLLPRARMQTAVRAYFSILDSGPPFPLFVATESIRVFATAIPELRELLMRGEQPGGEYLVLLHYCRPGLIVSDMQLPGVADLGDPFFAGTLVALERVAPNNMMHWTPTRTVLHPATGTPSSVGASDHGR